MSGGELISNKFDNDMPSIAKRKDLFAKLNMWGKIGYEIVNLLFISLLLNALSRSARVIMIV
jgi:hypothetical protein